MGVLSQINKAVSGRCPDKMKVYLILNIILTPLINIFLAFTPVGVLPEYEIINSIALQII